MRRLALSVLGCALLLAWGAPARALPYEEAFSLDAPIAWATDNASGTIDVIAGGPILNYETDAVCIESAGDATPNGGLGCANLTSAPTDISMQDWFVFTVTVDGGSSASIEQVGVAALFVTHDDSAGYFTTGTVGMTEAPDIATNGTENSALFPGDDIAVFSFSGAGDIDPGETTKPLFVGYPDGTLPAQFGMRFMITESGGASIDTVTGPATDTFTLIPEPSSLALLAGGLALLSGVARRRAR